MPTVNYDGDDYAAPTVFRFRPKKVGDPLAILSAVTSDGAQLVLEQQATKVSDGSTGWVRVSIDFTA
jgi:hypothetical protein